MLRERELTKILADSGSRILISQEDLYADVARAALPATAVQHAITTSPFDLLDPRHQPRASCRGRGGFVTTESPTSSSW